MPVELMGSEPQNTEVVIEDRYAVDVALPLGQFDTMGATALAARDLIDEGHKVYALVQRLAAPRRSALVSKLIGRSVPGLLTVRAEGILSLEESGVAGQRLVTVLDLPAGGRLVDDPRRFPAMPDRVIREQIVPHLAGALATLETLGLSHRNISLKNLYYKDRARTELVLGECFSSPPGCHLAPAYEPIERALADPFGRGVGDIACDMYALGVTLMSLFLGRDVAAATPSDEERQLDARMRLGSYWALGGSNELGGAIGELLRGLMEDNAAKRWNPEEVKRWANGLFARKAVSDPGWTLVRPAIFGEKSFKDRRALALAMLGDPKQAITFARSDRFRHWIEKALAEGPTLEWLDRAIDSRAPGNADDLSPADVRMAIARLTAVFFPEGAIIYGPLRFCADGIDTYLAKMFEDNDSERFELLRELIARGRLAAIMDIMAGRSEILKTGNARLAQLISDGTKPTLGYGLERCLYEFNKTLPCQSSKLRDSYVEDLKQLILALEAAAKKGSIGASVIDRHIAAFALRCSSNLEPVITRLSSLTDQSDAYLGETVRFLGRLQQKYYPKPLPNLANMLLPAFKRSVEALKSSTRRARTMQALVAMVEAGNLMRIGNELNFRVMKENDSREFRQAQQQLLSLGKLQKRLEVPATLDDPRVKLMGGRLAAWFAYVAFISVSAAVLYRFVI